MTKYTTLLTESKEVLDPRSLAPRHVVGIVLLVALALAPFGFNVIRLLALITALYFAVFTMSWDAVSGYTGQFSFGHSFLFAVGGYTSGILNLQYGIDPPLAIIIAVLVTMVAGFLFGAPALRLSGPYFAVVTFLLPIVLYRVFVLYNDVFGGQVGLQNPDPLVSVNGFAINAAVNYYVALAVFLVTLALLLIVTRSNAGSIFTGIREDEVAVAASGINPTKFKIFAFVLSAAVAGFGGAMFVHSPVGQPQPSQLLLVAVSVNVLLAAMLGGVGTITGAAAGGLVYSMLNNQLRQVDWVIPLLDVSVSEFSLVLFSLAVLIMVFYMPDGMLKWLTIRSRYLLTRFTGSETVTDGGRSSLDQTYDRHRRAMGDKPNHKSEVDTNNPGTERTTDKRSSKHE